MSTSQDSIFQSLEEKFIESGFDVSEKEGSLFSITNQSKQSFQIDVRILDLTVISKEQTIKIPKSDWDYELPDNLYVAYILLVKGLDLVIHLIPTNVFVVPDEINFFDNNQDERFKHFSNWKILFFKNAIGKLSVYSYDNVIVTLK